MADLSDFDSDGSFGAGGPPSSEGSEAEPLPSHTELLSGNQFRSMLERDVIGALHRRQQQQQQQTPTHPAPNSHPAGKALNAAKASKPGARRDVKSHAASSAKPAGNRPGAKPKPGKLGLRNAPSHLQEEGAAEHYYAKVLEERGRVNLAELQARQLRQQLRDAEAAGREAEARCARLLDQVGGGGGGGGEAGGAAPGGGGGGGKRRALVKENAQLQRRVMSLTAANQAKTGEIKRLQMCAARRGNVTAKGIVVQKPAAAPQAREEIEKEREQQPQSEPRRRGEGAAQGTPAGDAASSSGSSSSSGRSRSSSSGSKSPSGSPRSDLSRSSLASPMGSGGASPHSARSGVESGAAAVAVPPSGAPALEASSSSGVQLHPAGLAATPEAASHGAGAPRRPRRGVAPQGTSHVPHFSVIEESQLQRKNQRIRRLKDSQTALQGEVRRAAEMQDMALRQFACFKMLSIAARKRATENGSRLRSSEQALASGRAQWEQQTQALEAKVEELELASRRERERSASLQSLLGKANEFSSHAASSQEVEFARMLSTHARDMEAKDAEIASLEHRMLEAERGFREQIHRLKQAEGSAESKTAALFKRDVKTRDERIAQLEQELHNVSTQSKAAAVESQTRMQTAAAAMEEKERQESTQHSAHQRKSEKQKAHSQALQQEVSRLAQENTALQRKHDLMQEKVESLKERVEAQRQRGQRAQGGHRHADEGFRDDDSDA